MDTGLVPRPYPFLTLGECVRAGSRERVYEWVCVLCVWGCASHQRGSVLLLRPPVHKCLESPLCLPVDRHSLPDVELDERDVDEVPYLELEGYGM
eukprot:565584-Amphidinium_carterae.1